MATPSSGSETHAHSGLLQFLKGYLGVWVEVLRTRFDLVVNELEEERERLQQLVILAAATCFCLGVGVLLVTFFLVVLFWGPIDWRWLADGVAVPGRGVDGLAIRAQKVSKRPRLFSAPLANWPRTPSTCRRARPT